MDIWQDTTNINIVKKGKRFGLLSGITTNPTLISRSYRPIEDIIEDLLHYQEGPVAIQVVANETSEMIQQGQNYHSISDRLIIKIPVSTNGLEAIQLLSRQGISTMGTAIFNSRQGLMAALAGADFVAPYFGRIEQSGKDPISVLKQMVHIFQLYRLKTRILAASLDQVEQVLKCAETGIYGVTVKDALFEKLIENDPLTLNCMEQFDNDWKKVQKTEHIFKS
ncbi:MAG: transaldolase family protein [Parachlamydiaceae bacterium]|nr:transaldolase family protein [Parachlamydiaceae bacterium]